MHKDDAGRRSSSDGRASVLRILAGHTDSHVLLIGQFDQMSGFVWFGCCPSFRSALAGPTRTGGGSAPGRHGRASRSRDSAARESRRRPELSFELFAIWTVLDDSLADAIRSFQIDRSGRRFRALGLFAGSAATGLLRSAHSRSAHSRSAGHVSGRLYLLGTSRQNARWRRR